MGNIRAKQLSNIVGTIKALAAQGRKFTAEDVRAVTGTPDNDNDMGLAFSIARRVGVIKAHGYTIANRRPAHGRVLRVWQSSLAA